MKRSAVLRRESGAPRLLGAAEGYDLAAGTYDAWAWSRFWDQVETPLVEAWLRSRPTGDVLDLGCGSGRYRRLIQELGKSYTGVDVSKKMLEENLRKHRDIVDISPATLINGDIADVPLPDAAADSIICTRVLSHVRAPRKVFREIRRLLKPGGECFLSDIDPTHAYDYTHIPTPGGDVAIETHKHTWEALAKSIADIGGLTVVRRAVHTPQSLHSGATPFKLPNGRRAVRKPLLDVCVLRSD
jgi:ubiquinone/menaquinone biosynthesis C-methylase UbiE